jgi:hypothetical protein
MNTVTPIKEVVENKRAGILGVIDECTNNQQQLIFLMTFNLLIPYCNLEIVENSKKIDKLILKYLNIEQPSNQYLEFDYFHYEIQKCVQDCNIYFDDCLKFILKWIYLKEIHPDDLRSILKLLDLNY